MAGPYDYTVNIPQPPAQNFLQSLMGIQQLKGLQQQGELAQQQAAIQQQQAAFQQQMQPYEVQKAEAAIAAAKANAAQSGVAADIGRENLRQSKQTFAEQEETKKQENLLREDIMAVVKDPTLATQERLKDISFRTAIFASKSSEPLQRMFEDFPRAGKVLENTASDVIFAVQSGQPKVAVASVNKQLEAAQNSLQINPNDNEAKATVSLLKGVKSQMDEGKYGEAMVSASIFLKNQNSRKWNAVTGDLQELGKATKAVAEAKETQAKAKVEEAKLTPGGEKISDKQQSDINALTDEAVTARMNVAGVTDSVNELLKFAQQNPKEFKSGVEASFQNFFSSLTGDTTRAQNLRASIQPYATKEWIAKAAGLKGSLSEKEGARLDKGAPDVMKAGPQELLSWARLVQKVELADADKKELNAAWQQNARSLQSKAPVGFEVAGITVKLGESYQQVLTKLQAGYKKKSEQDVLDDAIRLKRIKEAEQTGRTPVPNMYNLGGAPQQPSPVAPNQISGTPERQSLLNKYR